MTDSTYIRNYTLYLNTSEANQVNVANTDVNFVLNNPIKLISQNNRFKCRIISATIPFTFKQVNSTNNVIQLVTTSGTINVTIPSGNYDINALATTFCNEIIAAILLNFGVVVVITPVFNSSTSFVTFTLTVSPAVYSIAVNYIPQNEVILNMLGFNGVNFVVANTALTITSNVAVNVNPAREIQLRSRTLTQNSSMEAITNLSSTSNVIANIPITSAQFGYIQFYYPLNYYNEIVTRTIDNINLYMTTTQGEMVGQTLASIFCLEIIEVGSYNQQIGLRQMGIMTESEKLEVQRLEQQKNILVASLDARLQNAKNKLKQKVLSSKVDYEPASKDEAQ
jgi:hypothetical protein